MSFQATIGASISPKQVSVRKTSPLAFMPGTHANETGLWQATHIDPLIVRFPESRYLSKLWNLRSFDFPLQIGNGFWTA